MQRSHSYWQQGYQPWKCYIIFVTWALRFAWYVHPRALGIHIRQITRAHVTTINCSWTLKIIIMKCQNEQISSFALQEELAIYTNSKYFMQKMYEGFNVGFYHLRRCSLPIHGHSALVWWPCTVRSGYQV